MERSNPGLAGWRPTRSHALGRHLGAVPELGRDQGRAALLPRVPALGAGVAPGHLAAGHLPRDHQEPERRAARGAHVAAAAAAAPRRHRHRRRRGGRQQHGPRAARHRGATSDGAAAGTLGQPAGRAALRGRPAARGGARGDGLPRAGAHDGRDGRGQDAAALPAAVGGQPAPPRRQHAADRHGRGDVCARAQRVDPVLRRRDGARGSAARQGGGARRGAQVVLRARAAAARVPPRLLGRGRGVAAGPFSQLGPQLRPAGAVGHPVDQPDGGVAPQDRVPGQGAGPPLPGVAAHRVPVRLGGGGLPALDAGRPRLRGGHVRRPVARSLLASQQPASARSRDEASPLLPPAGTPTCATGPTSGRAACS